MDNNFVNIVGYQLEKVHTGVIRWLLDYKNSQVTYEQKYEILSRIYKMCKKNIPYSLDDICCISCIPEYSFGRKRKIDLVVRINLFSGKIKYLVIEMKVDSIAHEEQLRGTYDDFINSVKCDSDDALFLLFLFGTSQVCSIPDLHGFHMFRLKEILEVFSRNNIRENLYDDWVQALREENTRKDSVALDIDDTNDLWNGDYWKDKGYRTWFPMFYYIYNELRKTSKRNQEWDIYSGQNNPVMNWEEGWLDKEILGHKVKFYWEFNYEDFVLKVKLDDANKMSEDDLNKLRTEIVDICNCCSGYEGRKTRNSYGIFNSIYKWRFNFKEKGLCNVIKEVDNILDRMHPMLKNI